jgi:hypothetical protein
MSIMVIVIAMVSHRTGYDTADAPGLSKPTAPAIHGSVGRWRIWLAVW